MKKKLMLLVVCVGILGCASFIKTRYDREHLSEASRLSVVYGLPELKPLRKYMMYAGNNNIVPLMSYFAHVKDLDVNGSFMLGLNRVREVMKRGSEPIRVYTDEECSDDIEKKNVNILYFPSETENSDKPFVMILAGGGYQCVCNLSEAYPVAAEYNRLGYPAFVLTYRVESTDALFPKPMEDIAQALKYIFNNYDSFALNGTHDYIIGGFSAGGHISAEWGTKNEGYEKYNLSSPSGIFLGYSAISSSYFLPLEDTEEAKQAMLKFRQHIVGENLTSEIEAQYSADQHVDSDYPPTYLVYCADDNMVDPVQSKNMAAALEAAGVRYIAEEGDFGGHGFATGSGTSVEGWIDRADAFFSAIE